MIAEKIYEGRTAKELGISGVEYESRRMVLLRFLADNEWNPQNYLAWLRTQEEGQYAIKQSFPPTSEMVKSAAAAAKGFVSSGFKLVEQEERDRRLSICETCSLLTNGRCVKCGCFMSLKSWLPKQTCPIERW